MLSWLVSKLVTVPLDSVLHGSYIVKEGDIRLAQDKLDHIMTTNLIAVKKYMEPKAWFKVKQEKMDVSETKCSPLKLEEEKDEDVSSVQLTCHHEGCCNGKSTH